MVVLLEFFVSGEVLEFLLQATSVEGPYPLSLALVGLGLFWCLGCFECPCQSSCTFSFLICVLFAPPHIMSIALQICFLDSGGPVAFASKSRVGV